MELQIDVGRLSIKGMSCRDATVVAFALAKWALILSGRGRGDEHTC